MKVKVVRVFVTVLEKLAVQDDTADHQVAESLFINRPRVGHVTVANKRDVLRDGRLCCEGEDILSDKRILQTLQVQQDGVSIKYGAVLWALPDKDLLRRKCQTGICFILWQLCIVLVKLAWGRLIINSYPNAS